MILIISEPDCGQFIKPYLSLGIEIGKGGHDTACHVGLLWVVGTCVFPDLQVLTR